MYTHLCGIDRNYTSCSYAVRMAVVYDNDGKQAEVLLCTRGYKDCTLSVKTYVHFSLEKFDIPSVNIKHEAKKVAKENVKGALNMRK